MIIRGWFIGLKVGTEDGECKLAEGPISGKSVVDIKFEIDLQ